MRAFDYLGHSVLHVLATCPNQDESIPILHYLKHQYTDLDINLLDRKGRTALFLAFESVNFDMAEVLAIYGGVFIADRGVIAELFCTIGF